jgi:hypothetical protein
MGVLAAVCVSLCCAVEVRGKVTDGHLQVDLAVRVCVCCDVMCCAVLYCVLSRYSNEWVWLCAHICACAVLCCGGQRESEWAFAGVFTCLHVLCCAVLCCDVLHCVMEARGESDSDGHLQVRDLKHQLMWNADLVRTKRLTVS